MAKPTIYKNNSDKIGFAVLYLTGAAATHYDNLLKQEEAGIPVPALRTWIDFVMEFTSGAAAWDSNVNSDNISGMVYGQSEDFASASSQNGNSGESLENQRGNDGVSKNPGDEEFLWAIQAARTPEQVKEFRQCCKLGLCYNCGGSDHIGKDCKNRENWDPPKNGTSSINNQQSDQLRAATFTLEGDPPNDEIWNVEIENDLGKAEGIPETH
ncbi:hypothetical protein GYMLUDRAFT_250372 [Collybiopsis luxurians FD-317 M1]|uniref:CCHC-type domain-containing protein n=1 Tax=Collybiopsis luxurians FD-317 M1 TaxID=944289 RepID=A0A0D0BFH5_9AGAR|nr:hypothetical protein GYMLUDRAFT_250372 [Collybiopsis luxurians FD-317 M1]